MPIITMGKTSVAARLLNYTVKEKPNNSHERVLHAAGLHCRVGTSAQEFTAHRIRHGKQSAHRKAPSKYKLPDVGEIATHVRRTRPNGRKYWQEVEEGATHVRHEGELVKENEAAHFIVSFGPDEVNPDDPGQVAHAFGYTVQMFREEYPGIQMQLVGQADGKGQKFHVHGVANAVVFGRMEVDGKVWEPGSKLSGALTNIDQVRSRHDAYLEAHPEFGFTQQAPSVAEQRKDKRSVMDRTMAAKGEVSNHDIIRGAFEEAMNDPRSLDLPAFSFVMAEHGVDVTEPGWRRGKPPKVRRLSYRVETMATNVTGETLGQHFMYEDSLDSETGEVTQGAASQLEANAMGQPRERRPKPQGAGPPKSLTKPTEAELTEAHEAVARIVHEERLDAWLDAWSDEEHMTVEDLLLERHMTRDNPADRETLHRLKQNWDAKKASKATQDDQAQTTVTQRNEGKAPAPREPRQPDGNIVDNEPTGTGRKPDPALAGQVHAWLAVRLDEKKRRDRELLVVVHTRKAADGVVPCDVQLNANDPAASGQRGLHAGKRWEKYTLGQVEAMRAAAGETSVTLPNGAEVLALQGDLVSSTGGLVLGLKRMGRSKEKIGQDVLVRQREAEKRAREKPLRLTVAEQSFPDPGPTVDGPSL